MFRASLMGDLFGPLHVEGYGFDLEVLYLAQKMNLRIKEVAINWSDVDGSKVDLVKDSLRMFWNIIQIRFIFKYNRDTSSFEKALNKPENIGQLVALSSLSLGQKALIMALSIDTEQGKRIQMGGVLPGETLEIVRLPPQGETIEIKIRGYFISLSKQEAGCIMVKLLS
jgi:Fe2+ transport system protein FeoA